MEGIVRSVCQACHAECGVLVHVDDDKVTRIEGDRNHPMNRGFACVKGRQYHQYVYHPDRLKYPLKRAGERGEGKWERISWGQALDEISKRVTECKEDYGRESIAVMHGTGPRPTGISQKLFAHALGSPNVISVDLHICFMPSLVAERVTIGQSVMMERGPDYTNANCIVIWGGNPVNSHPPKGLEVLEAKRSRNVKLVVVDPRRTRLAAKADLWLQVRPGTDLALALGMINVIVEERLYDKEFVDEWCHGFDRLKAHVMRYTPEKVAEITWVTAEKIREASRIYASTKPSALHHRVGIEQSVNSTQAVRALAILIAITGNIDTKGGNLLSVRPKGFKDSISLTKSFELDPSIEKRRIGAGVYPLIEPPNAPLPFVNSLLFVEAQLSGKPPPVKAMFIGGGNPLNIQSPKKVWEALKALNLLVVADFFMTPTGELADYVLPATTWIERDDCCDVPYTNYVSARQRAIKPIGESWDDMKMAIELVKRVPWADRRFIPWDTVEEFNEWRVREMGVSFEELKNRGYIMEPVAYKKYEKGGFGTPTGKIELYSTVFEKYGYEPLPTYAEPPSSPVSTPEAYRDFPLILISGARRMNYFGSEGRQIPSLRRDEPEPKVEIHPRTAKRLGIAEGDWVWIETSRVRNERVRFRASLTTGVDPRVVEAAHGWWFPERPGPEHGCFQSNINLIIPAGLPREPICGSVPARGELCRVYKA